LSVLFLLQQRIVFYLFEDFVYFLHFTHFSKYILHPTFCFHGSKGTSWIEYIAIVANQTGKTLGGGGIYWKAKRSRQQNQKKKIK
jgi:hypothetical protein